ncbi:MAG TPA: hypothetical protein VGM03_17210, partial [Phycisphaerae bacterium]
ARAALAGVDIAICAAGPFQDMPLTLVNACLDAGIHYIDLCDDRSFLFNVHRLVEQSRHQRGLPAICTGWSAVPALSATLVEIATSGWNQIDSIEIHIAPGNRAPRSVATVSSLLASTGKPFTILRDGRWQTVTGWSEPRYFPFPPPVGRRAGYLVDVPDHELFPKLFGARRVEFRVGSELELWNRALALLARFARRRALPKSYALASLLRSMMALLGYLGRDCGAVGVRVCGSSARSEGVRHVSVVAARSGQRIPVMPAVIATKLLLSGHLARRGIVPVNSWLTRDQLESECRRRGYDLIVEDQA